MGPGVVGERPPAVEADHLIGRALDRATDTGSLGLQSAGSAKVSPARLTMAATRADRSQAIRYDMNPPFECPTTAIRFGSMASALWMSAITADR